MNQIQSQDFKIIKLTFYKLEDFIDEKAGYSFNWALIAKKRLFQSSSMNEDH